MLQKIKFKNSFLKVIDKEAAIWMKTSHLISKEKAQLLQLLPYYNPEDLLETENLYQKLSKLDYWVVFGMGGAILNSQIYVDFLQNTKVFFIDDLSESLIDQTLEKCNLAKTGFLFISNGGNTIEVLALAKTLFNKYKITADKVVFSYSRDQSLLAQLHQAKGGHFLPYDSNMGGRFSTFTRTTSFIMKIIQAKTQDLFKGANKTIALFHTNSLPVLEYDKESTIVSCTYYPELKALTYWFGSSLAESLGKKGINIKSIILNMPLDQHGLLQGLIVSNTKQIFNIFKVNKPDKIISPITRAAMILEETLLAELDKAGIAYRIIMVPGEDLEALGELLTYLILEIIMAACSFNLDPFNQPEIDNIKSQAAKLWQVNN